LAALCVGGRDPAGAVRPELPRKGNLTPADLLARTQHVIDKEQVVVRSQLIRNRIELYTGHGRFTDEHTLLTDDQHRAERSAGTPS
jgi:pyruvate/2-oxoglutarate dehydrogenase complex dihydrolipoamide dehydrogenase (E3) component